MINKFKNFVSNYQQSNHYKEPLGFGIARVDIAPISKKDFMRHLPCFELER